MATPRSMKAPRDSAVADEVLTAEIDSLDQEGRGVARFDGKVAFIEGALPGERVLWQRRRSKARFDTGRVIQVLRASSVRAQPRCPHFGLEQGSCGGCTMQHLDARAQVAVKQRALEESLQRLGRVRPEIVLRPVAGPTWQYRHRARLSVRFVERKGGVLVGFHERASSYVAELRECTILAKPVGTMLLGLRELVAELSIRDRLPQIEVAITPAATVLVLRVLDPPSQADRAALAAFARARGIALWLQPAGPDTAAPLEAQDAVALELALPEFGLRMPFRPTDFTQVNHRVNEILVRRAVGLLAPEPGETVVDFFCGMGNFTLPIATRASRVIGLEGNAELLRRAGEASRGSRLDGRTTFAAHNLFEWTRTDWQALRAGAGGRIDRLLIDPPRDGALAVVQALAGDSEPPKRIVYVSCNPATLARDCGYLVHEAGWNLKAAGIVNMFPHTSHVESIAVLEPGVPRSSPGGTV